jgi:hypothetical protein
MQPVDIYNSYCLGTNVVHAATYKILADMGKLLGKENPEYEKIFNNVKNGINKYLWLENEGYYSQFIYGRNYESISPKSESLGESLSILFDIAGDRAADIIKNVPVVAYGTPCVYPQEKNIPPYHNNGIWPFVEAYRMWAAKTVNNEEAVLQSIASILRSSSLFLTNKENFVAADGNPVGTEINSDRQLWSVAGNLAIVYRILFGMNFTPGKLGFSPFLPSELKGEHKLSGLKYGNAVYDIIISGEGNQIERFEYNGIPQQDHSVALNNSGRHKIEIKMKKGETTRGINLVENYFAPTTPEVSLNENYLSWYRVPGASGYTVFINGKKAAVINDTIFSVTKSNGFFEYQVAAIDEKGVISFLSEPVRCGSTEEVEMYELLSDQGDYVILEDNSGSVEFSLEVDKPGVYSIDFRYANGNGPINTDNKCAIRTLKVNEDVAGIIVMPQRGTSAWDEWGYSNHLIIYLKEGSNSFHIYFDPLNTNMNFIENKALLGSIRLTFIPDSVKDIND